MESQNIKIGFIGSGNMAGALLKGLIESGLYKPDMLSASDSDKDKLGEISGRFGIKSCDSNSTLAAECNVIVLAVKPFVIREVLEEIRDVIKDNHLIISIAAGIPIRMIQSVLERDVPVIRVMPNTPALIQKGVSALAPGKTAGSDHMKVAEGIFQAVGKTVFVDEKMMDSVTAISGSGPGYVFKIMELFVEAAQKQGFDSESALLLVLQTFLGAAQLADKSDLSLSQLREMVVTPGGTTAAGISFFDEKKLDEIIQGAVDAARDRSAELGKKY